MTTPTARASSSWVPIALGVVSAFIACALWAIGSVSDLAVARTIWMAGFLPVMPLYFAAVFVFKGLHMLFEFSAAATEVLYVLWLPVAVGAPAFLQGFLTVKIWRRWRGRRERVDLADQ